jgi:hypothetical protein
MLRRLPLQSGQPLLWFAYLRAVIVTAGLISVAAFDVPHRGRVALVIGVVAVPWAAWLLLQARRRPEIGCS